MVFFIPDPSAFMRQGTSAFIACAGISGHLNVPTSLCDLNIFKLKGLSQSPGALAADCTGRFTASNYYRRQEKGDLVDQACLEKLARHACSTFNQDAL